MELTGLSTYPRTSASKYFTRTKCHVKYFKVSQAIKKIAEDITPMNNYMQVPLKMPVDTPLKIHTWKDSRELIVDPIIQHLKKQNNDMNYAKKVVDDIE